MASMTRAAPTVENGAKMSARAKWTVAGIVAGSGIAGLLGAGSSALAAYFARRVITPSVREADQEVLAVVRGDQGLQVILAATPDTVVDGVFSLYFAAGTGFARIGRIVSYSPAERTVQREVEEVYSGDLATARRGWWSGAVYDSPAALGLDAEDIQIDVEGGQAPAWLVPSGAGEPSKVWAIMVHGRGATRIEGLRAVRTARDLGLDSLLVSYRNEGWRRPLPTGGTAWVPRNGTTSTPPLNTRSPMAPTSGLVRLVDGRSDLPADGRSLAQPPCDQGHGPGRAGHQLGQRPGTPRTDQQDSLRRWPLRAADVGAPVGPAAHRPLRARRFESDGLGHPRRRTADSDARDPQRG